MNPFSLPKTVKSKPKMTPRNFHDIEQNLNMLGYTPGVAKNLRAALRKSTVHYKTDCLSRIPADLEAFDRQWGTGRVSRIPESFKTKSQFLAWRKNCRQSLVRFHSAPAKRDLMAGWDLVLASARANQGRAKLLGENSDISLGVFASVLSHQGIAPDHVNDAAVDKAHRETESSRRKSFRRGLDRFNSLIAQRDCLPELARVLPDGTITKPMSLGSAANRWRRAANNPAATMIWEEFDRIMRLKRFGEDGPQLVGAPEEFKASSVQAYETSMNWFLRELAAVDLLDDRDPPELSDIVTQGNIIAACNNWKDVREAKGQPTGKSTLHTHVTRLVHLAIAYLGARPQEARRLEQLRKKPAIRTKSVGGMSESREKWIKDFASNPAKQAKAHRLPETLMNAAQVILAREGANCKPRKGEIMTALRMGVAAMQSAILFRASPVRSTNIRFARYRGDGAEFALDARLKKIRFQVPGASVKNGADIDEIADDDLMPIYEWYISVVRRRLIENHPFGAENNHVDSDFLFPSTSGKPMGKSEFAANFRRGCCEISFDMEMHQARHVCTYWILSIDPNAWSEAAALLGDKEATIRKYYAWLDLRKASDAGRKKLREARTARARHRKGDFTDAA